MLSHPQAASTPSLRAASKAPHQNKQEHSAKAKAELPKPPFPIAHQDYSAQSHSPRQAEPQSGLNSVKLCVLRKTRLVWETAGAGEETE